MFRLIKLLDAAAIDRLRAIAGQARWIDGRGSNPTNPGKKNLQLATGALRDEAGTIVGEALRHNAMFNEYALPVAIPAPQLSLMREGMGYAPHADNAVMTPPSGRLRGDIAVTTFLSDPDQYEGGALTIYQGDVKNSFRLPAGDAIAYPATMLHEVGTVTSGERLVAFTFVQSQIADPIERQLASELGIIARVERERLTAEGHARLLVIQQNLLRRWGDAP